ncbi:hypothetical protein KW796_03060 [Candidatus Parcubacteria bacterium]|nr:hypothetical protein [Candidatus Parcubacteria bacterium]
MVSIEEMRRLQPELSSLTDKELEKIQAEMHSMAQLAFDVWWQRKTDSKYPLGLSLLKKVKDTM